MDEKVRRRWVGSLAAGLISGGACALFLVLGPWLLGWPNDRLAAGLGCLVIAIISGVACGVLSAVSAR